MFQWAMSYAFHDIKHIVEPYLDDFPTHSAHQKDHIFHLREIFLRCRHSNICLNPHKCIFIVESGRLLGFIVSKDGIRVDPLKFKSILTLPPPNNLTQLQSLQGKENFLHHFICNYVEITKGCFNEYTTATSPQQCERLHPLFHFLYFHYCHGVSTRG